MGKCLSKEKRKVQLESATVVPSRSERNLLQQQLRTEGAEYLRQPSAEDREEISRVLDQPTDIKPYQINSRGKL
jgi:Rad3-related DNA helicase